MSEQPNNALYGVISMAGTYLVIAIIAFFLGAYNPTLSSLWDLLVGNYQHIKSTEVDLSVMIPICLAVVALELPCTIISSLWIENKLGAHTGIHEVADMINKITKGSLFFKFFTVVLIEELFARLLFLGILTQVFTSTFSFYVLFIVGNGVWSLIHLYNFSEEKERNPLRTLPQFVAGIFFTMIYVKFGLLAVILTHFASNAILFSADKRQNINKIDFWIISYSSACAVLSFLLISKPLTDLVVWFSPNPIFAIPSWAFGDYVAVGIFVSSTLTALLGILCYDRGRAGNVPLKGITKLPKWVMISLPVIILAFTYLVYWVISLFVPNVLQALLITSVAFACLEKGASTSAMGNTFWQTLPTSYVSLCILLALWQINPVLLVMWVIINYVVMFPKNLLIAFDD